MTGARDASLVSLSRLLRFARNDDRAMGDVVIFVLNALFPNISFFLPNPAKTC